LQTREQVMNAPPSSQAPPQPFPSLSPVPAKRRSGDHATDAAHAPFLSFVRYIKGDRNALGGVSVVLARQRAETALLAADRVLALLCRIEAIADHRADNDVAAVAKLPAIRDLARSAIAAYTRAPFDNPLFPLRQL
jgi:hypothetical protein